MSRYPDIDTCIQAARLIAAAGEMAPFPFIKGVAQCVIVILETIDRAAKNKSDLHQLAESIVTTLVAVRDTVIEHGPTSALSFQNICLEFQTYMSDLLSQLNSERRSCARIRRLLKSRKITDEISTYRQRVEAAKAEFLIRAATSTRLGLSDVQDQVDTGIIAKTRAIEGTQNKITATINDRSDIMREEIHSRAVSQSEKMDRLFATAQERGVYKGVVREVLWGDINLREYIEIPKSHSFQDSEFDEYIASVENHQCPKIVRVYRVQAGQKDQIMQRFYGDVDQRLHPNFVQLFGVCTTPSCPALIFHGSTAKRQRVYDYYCDLSSAKESLLFSIEIYHDLKSLADYLGRQEWFQKIDMIDAEDYGDVFLNEEHRVIFTDFTSGAYLAWSLCLRLCPKHPAVLMRDDDDPDRWDLELPTRLMPLLARPANLQKENLWEIYECLYWFLGHTMQFEVRYPRPCRYYPGCFEKWRVAVDLGCTASRINALQKATLCGSVVVWYSLSPDCSYSFRVFPSSCVGYKNRLRLVFSYFAQAFGLRTDWDIRTNVNFYLEIQPRVDTSRNEGSIQLSISVPPVHAQNLWPFSFFADGVRVSPEEAEYMFGVKIEMTVVYDVLGLVSRRRRSLPSTQELNAMCGFDPARGGEDVRDYFGLYSIKLLDEISTITDHDQAIINIQETCRGSIISNGTA
ncbi:hypothetical protein ARMGADRAFT_1093193 [Armillaria gallica]|uniref:Uncharacterized protein n=1 Tax=Armillaria gallica TaxID=47427 RepID=A0A2H3CTD8_ARMGA|nr:hypothetical protein ARMGADRAFT_1093193 [Armillaria gallica]